MKTKGIASTTAAFALAVALAGCVVNTPAGPTPAQLSAQHDTGSALAACAYKNAADVDDHMSEASLIALALYARCRREYAAMVDAYAAPLDPMVALRFQEQLYNEDREVETFLPAVIAERKHQLTAIAEGAALVPAKGMRTVRANIVMPVDTIVEQYGLAVVNIRATTAPREQASMPAPASIEPDDPFFAFFQRPAPQPQGAQGRPPRVLRGVGSGFIISLDGLVVTTAHVVNRAEAVTVGLTDGREFEAKVLTVDPQSDVALLQIEGATKLPVVKLGDSSHVRVGEPVLTIGSLDGAANTATAGIVSATPRTLPDGTRFPFFQTDIAVNPDNSGGPLFNRAGEVIGVDVQIYADTERHQSLTFAIPISAAIKLRAQSQAQAKRSRGGLGLTVQDVSPGLAAAFGLPRPAGALVNAVEPGARGAALALKPGDVITQIGDKTIDHSADLIDYVARLWPGTKVPLKLVRNRKTHPALGQDFTPSHTRLLGADGLSYLRACRGREEVARAERESQLQQIAEEQAHVKEEQARTGTHPGTDECNRVHCDCDGWVDHSPDSGGRTPDFPCVGVGRDNGERRENL
jgi:serine protease Do